MIWIFDDLTHQKFLWRYLAKPVGMVLSCLRRGSKSALTLDAEIDGSLPICAIGSQECCYWIFLAIFHEPSISSIPLVLGSLTKFESARTMNFAPKFQLFLTRNTGSHKNSHALCMIVNCIFQFSHSCKLFPSINDLWHLPMKFLIFETDQFTLTKIENFPYERSSFLVHVGVPYLWN